MDPIADILDELRAGRMIVLADDEDRENEGDLVIPAECATPDAVNFMLREARGMMCVALGPEVCDAIQLEPQSRVNTSQRSTAYTITVDALASFGITTGVSAHDRSVTIQRLAHPEASPHDFDRPGHIQPLRARRGGVLVRAGQTEGSVDLCRMAGLRPAAVIIEVMNDDGTMARRPQLEALCDQHRLKMCSVAQLIKHRLGEEHLIQRVGEPTPIDTPAGPFTAIAYRSRVDALPHLALCRGRVGQRTPEGGPVDMDHPVLVRMHSQNLLGDVFGDTTQPSGDTLHAAMRMIADADEGAVVYLRHEGMGKGLLQQLQTHTPPELAHEESSYDGNNHSDDDGYQPGKSQPNPGTQPPRDSSAYGIGSQILRDLGIRQLRLISNHPVHPTALDGFGLSINEFVPVKP